MDFLEEETPIDVGGEWRIHSANPPLPPHYIGPEAKVSHALLNEGAVVLGTVEHSVISSGVRIGTGAKITDSVVMPFAVIEDGAVVDHAILGPRTRVMPGAKVKGTPDAIAVTGENETVEAAG